MYLAVVSVLGTVRGLLLPADGGSGCATAAAVLLVTLPVLSLPSLLMVRHVFPARLLAGTTGVVAVVPAPAPGPLPC